jgi:hypothetical protein
MSDITMTIVRHRGEMAPLGKNFAVRMLLEKSQPVCPTEGQATWPHASRNNSSQDAKTPHNN